MNALEGPHTEQPWKRRPSEQGCQVPLFKIPVALQGEEVRVGRLSGPHSGSSGVCSQGIFKRGLLSTVLVI